MFNNLNQWLSLEYDSFYLDDNDANYTIHITGYSGELPFDPMNATNINPTYYHNGLPFTTYDVDHDKSPYNCAYDYGGGWWWNNCHFLCLNGKYGYKSSGIYPAFGYKDINPATGFTTWSMLSMSRMMAKCTWVDVNAEKSWLWFLCRFTLGRLGRGWIPPPGVFPL